jgi:hypothetical protein
MGSRLQLTDERTWDPDDTLHFFEDWAAISDRARHKNRTALSTTITPYASTLQNFALWPPAFLLKNSAIRDILKRETGASSLQVPLQIGNFFGKKRNWASVIFLFYGTILQRLEAAFNSVRSANPVYAFGYDFRKSASQSGADLINFVRNTVLSEYPNSAKQVILITHSMGGLVARAAFARDQTFVDQVRGVVHGAQPSNGAVVCYTRFVSGDYPPIEPLPLTLTVPIDFLMTTIIGQNSHEFTYLLAGMPGGVCLLPNSQFQAAFAQGNWIDGHVAGGKWLDGLDAGDLSDVYSIYAGSGPGGLLGKAQHAQIRCGTDDEKNNGRIVKEMTNSLSQARAFHDNLTSAPNNAFHPSTVVLYSWGLDTMHSVRFIKDDPDPKNQFLTRPVPGGGTEITNTWEQVAFTRMPSGDTVVPETSAKCPGASGAHPEGACKEIHGAVYGNEYFNNRVLFYVSQILAGPPAAHAENDATSSDQQLAENDSDAEDDDADSEADGEEAENDADSDADSDDAGGVPT